MRTNPTDQKEFLKRIIDFAFEYLEKSPSRPEVVEFAAFLSQREKTKKKDRSLPKGSHQNSPADDLGIRLVLLNRYAKEYVKIALADTELQTADEFPFLMALLVGGSHTKSELFDKMLLTKTTGTEILKRLRLKGLVLESADKKDKRSKRVELSAKGKKLVLELLPRMSKVSELVSGNLSTSELGNLNYLLKKLSTHHRVFFAEHSEKELKTAIQER